MNAYPLPHNYSPMRSALPIPPILIAALAMVALAGCQPGTARPVPSVPQIGGDLKCSQGDHGYEDPQAGWGFCYPGTWRYTEHAQANESPAGFDLVLDVFNDPCGHSGCGPGEGDFAVIIISTYDRDSAPDLASWMAAHIGPSPNLQSISWGNAIEAARLPDGRRIALTQHQVVVMDLRSGPLDLEPEMSARLATWKFDF
jgi:hypothetical protein